MPKQERIVVPYNLHKKGADTTPKPRLDEFALKSIDIPDEFNKYTYNRFKEQRDNIWKQIWLGEGDGFPPMMTTQFSQYKDPNKTRDYYNFYKSRIISDPFAHDDVRKEKYGQVGFDGCKKKPSRIPIGYRYSSWGFSNHEKILMRQALACCVRCSNKAFESSAKLFVDNIEQFERWFGAYEHESIMRIRSGVSEMNKVLSNPEKILTFIDMRQQRQRGRPRAPMSKPAPGSSTCYGTSCQEMFTGKLSEDPFAPVAFGVPEHLPAIGLRILVGEQMLQYWQSPIDRALIIYHEISHKILCTLDKGFVRLSDGTRSMEPVFGVVHTREMVKEFPRNTLSHADCWANFIVSFGE